MCSEMGMEMGIEMGTEREQQIRKNRYRERESLCKGVS